MLQFTAGGGWYQWVVVDERGTCPCPLMMVSHPFWPLLKSSSQHAQPTVSPSCWLARYTLLDLLPASYGRVANICFYFLMLDFRAFFLINLRFFSQLPKCFTTVLLYFMKLNFSTANPSPKKKNQETWYSTAFTCTVMVSHRASNRIEMKPIAKGAHSFRR